MLVRLGTGVSYVLIYASLLVKLVFLISLNTGVYLPAMYQALLLFFAVLVQVTRLATRASNEYSRSLKLKNHGEGPYLDILLFGSGYYCFHI